MKNFAICALASIATVQLSAAVRLSMPNPDSFESDEAFLQYMAEQKAAQEAYMLQLRQEIPYEIDAQTNQILPLDTSNLTFDDFALGNSLQLWDDLDGETIENPPAASYQVPESDDTVSIRIAPIAGSNETTNVDIAVLPALWETPLSNTVQPLTPVQRIPVEPIINTPEPVVPPVVEVPVVPEFVQEITDPSNDSPDSDLYPKESKKSRKGKKGKKGKK